MDLAVSVKVTSLVFIWFSHIIVTSTHMALVQLFTLQLLEWNLHQDNNLICAFLRLYLFPSHVRFTQAAWWRQQRKHFPRYWPFVQGIHRSPVYSPYKGKWRGALMFSLICTWINGWINEREAIDLRRVRTHYDVTVMWASIYVTNLVINSTQLKIFLLNIIQQHIQKHVKAETPLGLFASVYLVHVQGIIRPSQQTEQVGRTKQETTQILCKFHTLGNYSLDLVNTNQLYNWSESYCIMLQSLCKHFPFKKVIFL